MPKFVFEVLKGLKLCSKNFVSHGQGCMKKRLVCFPCFMSKLLLHDRTGVVSYRVSSNKPSEGLFIFRFSGLGAHYKGGGGGGLLEAGSY